MAAECRGSPESKWMKVAGSLTSSILILGTTPDMASDPSPPTSAKATAIWRWGFWLLHCLAEELPEPPWLHPVDFQHLISQVLDQNVLRAIAREYFHGGWEPGGGGGEAGRTGGGDQPVALPPPLSPPRPPSSIDHL